MTETEILRQIVQKQDELLKIDDDIVIVYRLLAFEDSFSTQANKLENERDFLYEKFRDIKNELASLRQQLEKSKETKLSLPLDIPTDEEIKEYARTESIVEVEEDGEIIEYQSPISEYYEEGAKWAIDEIIKRNRVI